MASSLARGISLTLAGNHDHRLATAPRISDNSRVLQVLRSHFGFDSFRDGQESVIQTLLDGRSALAIFPTGGGKSLCYQIPALMLDGLTLVISPLIALMQDQVSGLNARGISAARLDSSLGPHEVDEIYRRLQQGELKLLYVAPERFSNQTFRRQIKKIPIQLAAIDEAHCISEWGHNFRPDYLKLASYCRSLKIPRVLCLTATATPKVARDIRKAFRIRQTDHVQLSFHRPNLDLRITPCSPTARKNLLLERLKTHHGPAIVYVTRQETAEELSTFLATQGLAVRAYHAGLPIEFRSATQYDFMQGKIRVIVATIAFGMGIDKADIRAVYHYNLPKSLENYTQEIGRAGRDGKHAICEMLACANDLTVLENFIHADAPTPRALGNLVDRLLRLGKDFDISPYELSTTCDIRTNVLATVITYLEIDGILESLGSHYANYRAKLMRPLPTILHGRPPTERKLIQLLLDATETKRGSLHFLPDTLAARTNQPRAKIISLLTDLEAAGDISLSPSSVRQRYRLKRDPGDLKKLTATLVEKFSQREHLEISRLAHVLGLSAQRGCLTAHLTKHFGEKLPTPCGHCDRCRSLPAKTLKRPASRQATDQELLLIKALNTEKHASLSTPRQLARFLCGMASPAATRAKLTKHPAFAILSDMQFTDVLTLAEAATQHP